MRDESNPKPLFVTEQFVSVQGEGTLTGMPSVFVRLAGCNLRCSWCDTPYSSWSPEGSHIELDAIVEDIVSQGPMHVVLTGGEPMLQSAAVPLTHRLAARGLHITVETAGTIDAPMHIDLASISPKLSDSTPEGPAGLVRRHEENRSRPDVVARLVRDHAHQLKFVVGPDTDFDEIRQFIAAVEAELGKPLAPDCIQLMPRGRDVDSLDRNLALAVPQAMAHGWRISDRLHVRLFGDARGT